MSLKRKLSTAEKRAAFRGICKALDLMHRLVDEAPDTADGRPPRKGPARAGAEPRPVLEMRREIA
jgi:hypothetical protein